MRRLNTTGPGDRKVPRGAGPWDRVCPGSFSTIPCSRNTLLKLVKKLALEYKSTSCFLHWESYFTKKAFLEWNSVFGKALALHSGTHSSLPGRSSYGPVQRAYCVYPMAPRPPGVTMFLTWAHISLLLWHSVGKDLATCHSSLQGHER